MEVPTAKTRRVHHDAGFKRKVILCAESDGNRAASRAFSVPETSCLAAGLRRTGERCVVHDPVCYGYQGLQDVRDF
ncbi:unnamed protein product [Ixodes pacificus]